MLPGEWPGQVQHLEGAVAEIDHVALVEQAGGRGGGDLDHARIEAVAWQGVDEQIAELVAGRAVRVDRGAEVGRAQRGRTRLGDDVGLGPVDGPMIELGQPADVVTMAVGRHRQQRSAQLALDQVA